MKGHFKADYIPEWLYEVSNTVAKRMGHSKADAFLTAFLTQSECAFINRGCDLNKIKSPLMIHILRGVLNNVDASKDEGVYTAVSDVIDLYRPNGYKLRFISPLPLKEESSFIEQGEVYVDLNSGFYLVLSMRDTVIKGKLPCSIALAELRLNLDDAIIKQNILGAVLQKGRTLPSVISIEKMETAWRAARTASDKATSVSAQWAANAASWAARAATDTEEAKNKIISKIKKKSKEMKCSKDQTVLNIKHAIESWGNRFKAASFAVEYSLPYNIVDSRTLEYENLACKILELISGLRK